jgi:hypothetical protein
MTKSDIISVLLLFPMLLEMLFTYFNIDTYDKLK